MFNGWLFAAGVLDALASGMHLACSAGGPAWYRFFGAGERIVRLAERRSWKAPLVTGAIATILASWSAYSFSGAGVLRPLPLLRPALVAISAAYLVRAAMLPLMLKWMPDRSRSFLVVSSLIVLGFGIVHAIGIASSWNVLG
jgi:hypothetical protein